MVNASRTLAILPPIPGLLTDGLPSEETYVWGDIVSDCITAVQILLQQPNIDSSRLAVSGGDMAYITAALTEGVHALQTGGLMFADIDNRTAGDPDYPMAEFNDLQAFVPRCVGKSESNLGQLRSDGTGRRY